eukprot:gene26124-9881_t
MPYFDWSTSMISASILQSHFRAWRARRRLADEDPELHETLSGLRKRMWRSYRHHRKVSLHSINPLASRSEVRQQMHDAAVFIQKRWRMRREAKRKAEQRRWEAARLPDTPPAASDETAHPAHHAHADAEAAGRHRVRSGSMASSAVTNHGLVPVALAERERRHAACHAAAYEVCAAARAAGAVPMASMTVDGRLLPRWGGMGSEGNQLAHGADYSVGGRGLTLLDGGPSPLPAPRRAAPTDGAARGTMAWPAARYLELRATDPRGLDA